MAKKEKQLDAFEIALSAVAAPYTFIYDRIIEPSPISDCDKAKINGNTRVVTVPYMDRWTLESLALCFLNEKQMGKGRFEQVVIKDCMSSYDGKCIGHTLMFW